MNIDWVQFMPIEIFFFKIRLLLQRPMIKYSFPQHQSLNSVQVFIFFYVSRVIFTFTCKYCSVFKTVCILLVFVSRPGDNCSDPRSNILFRKIKNIFHAFIFSSMFHELFCMFTYKHCSNFNTVFKLIILQVINFIIHTAEIIVLHIVQRFFTLWRHFHVVCLFFCFLFFHHCLSIFCYTYDIDKILFECLRCF
jgi:hypothetical protein